jgi:monovalent cation/hydrogen antiporter
VLALEVIVILGVTVLIGTTLGGRYSVAPPVLLLVFGALLGFVPLLSHVVLEPDAVLLLFLPAILYWESLNTSLREIRANLRVIALLGIALVLATMVAVSFTAQALGMEPSAAWVLGAVLAPTDAAAVAGLARQMPRRALTTLRAESLINDGTALVLYAVAVAIATGETRPGPPAVVGMFLGSYTGGIAAGLAASAAIVIVRKRLDDPVREGALSVLTPFLAFLLAEMVHASGVVAVVVTGLVLTYVGPTIVRAASRVQAIAFWDLSTFLLNGGLFVLIGVQFVGVVRDLDGVGVGRAVAFALVVTAVVVGTRLAWVHVTTWLVRLIDRRPAQRLRRATWRQRTATGWAGFRGAVSLAAALAVPAAVRSGATFPDRDLILFTTSVVIFLTILVQGTTLPAVVRWARLPEDTARAEELLLARSEAVHAALDALPQVAAELGVTGDLLHRIEEEYRQHVRVVDAEDGDFDAARTVTERELDRRLRLALLDCERRRVTQLRDANRIDDIVLRELQATMDVEEVRLLGPAPAE